MILGYILSFSILITSVIKVTGVLIHLDKKMNSQVSRFTTETKSLHNNQKGSLTLAGALFALMISALLLFFTLKYKTELKEVRYRKDSYLCFHYLNIQTENYIKDMAKFNIAIRSAFAAQLALGHTARAALEAAVLTRNARHFYYVKNLVKNSWCKGHTQSLSWIKNFPFEITPAFTLVTNIDQTAKLRKNKWKITHYKNPSGIRLKKSFCLTADMSAQSAFFPDFKIKTAEVPMAGLSKLKCSSGFL